MPKHNIYPTPNPDGSGADRRIELHWQRDGGVQLASTRWAGDPAKVDFGQDFVQPNKDGDPLVPAWQGDFADLDRTQLNHLIRQLRTARDQAFGKDE
jgi:hypothetical protein